MLSRSTGGPRPANQHWQPLWGRRWGLTLSIWTISFCPRSFEQKSVWARPEEMFTLSVSPPKFFPGCRRRTLSLIPASIVRLWTTCPLVEGAYSFHPYYGDYADLKIFYDIDPLLQLARIEKRNGPEGLRNFQSRWIPMEESYHMNCHTLDQAELVIRAGDFFLSAKEK